MLSKSEAKYIQSLSQKKFRVLENAFVIEGPKIVDEALHSHDVYVKKIYALPEWVAANEEHSAHTKIINITETELSRISQLQTPHQVVAVAAMPVKEFILKANLALVLDGIQDPGNLGTIIRIADWFGISQIICSHDCADAYNIKVVQATMGSIFRTEIFYTDLTGFLSTQNKNIIGATLDGIPLKKFGRVTDALLVIGNESKGIRTEVFKFIQQKITIEKTGNAESLNAAVATGIILSQIK